MKRSSTVVLVSLLMGACGEPQQHPAVGEWRSSSGDVLRLLADGTGSFESRACTWKTIDDYSVQTNCEEAIRDNSVRSFTVTTKDSQEVGNLESLEEEFQRTEDGAETAQSQEKASLCAENLEPTWISNREAVQAIEGQVLIAAFNSSEYSATLRVTLPDGSLKTFEDMPVATRRVLIINDATFFLDLLDAANYRGAQVSLTCKK